MVTTDTSEYFIFVNNQNRRKRRTMKKKIGKANPAHDNIEWEIGLIKGL